MNIRTVTSPVSALDLRQTEKAEREVKTDSSHDKDANGKREQGEEQRKRKLTDEEMKEALEKLRNLDGVKKNQLVVRLTDNEGARAVHIEEMSGRVIRRIPEAELWFYVQEKENATKGHLFDKAG